MDIVFILYKVKVSSLKPVVGKVRHKWGILLKAAIGGDGGARRGDPDTPPRATKL